MPIDRPRRNLIRALVLLTWLVIVTACGDQTDSIVINSQRYFGTSIPLEVIHDELTPLGFVGEAAHANRIGLEIYALPGIDPAQVVLVRRPPDSQLGEYIVYRGGTAAEGNLFEKVPALCEFSPPLEECD